MSNASSAPTGRILQLDGLRGMAVILVVLYHYSLDLVLPTGSFLTYLKIPFRMGWCGVDLFFVLSGFLIGGILLDARESPRYFQTFYSRRFHRILPLYCIWIGAYFLVAFTLLPHSSGSFKIEPEKWTIVPTYIFFVQNLVKKRLSWIAAAWLSPLWSLAVEEQFYLVMPFLVRFFPRRWLLVSLFAAIAGAPLARIIVFHWDAGHTAQYVATPCRADALAMGVLLALGWRNESWKSRFMGARKLLYVVVFMLLIPVVYLAVSHPSSNDFATSTWGLSCLDAFFAALLSLVLIVPHGLCATFFRWSLLRDVGGVSYCIYVIHQAINALCRSILTPANEGITAASSIGVTVLAIGITWMVAKISWHYLEGPLVRRGHAYRY